MGPERADSNLGMPVVDPRQGKLEYEVARLVDMEGLLALLKAWVAFQWTGQGR